MDSQLLDRCKDVFPDNYTKRQISELQVVCPFECCNQEISMAKYEHHIAHCPHKVHFALLFIVNMKKEAKFVWKALTTKQY